MNYFKNLKLSRNHNFEALALLFVCTIFFNACEKDVNVTQALPDHMENTQASSKIMQFNSFEEYLETKQEVLQMTFEELQAFEESKNFISQGRAEEEFYNKIDPESFSSIEELKLFVAENSKFIKLVEDEDGEQELITINENNSDRYFLNSNGMYQVENVVYKVLSDEIKVSSNVEDINKLMQLDLANYKTNISSEFKIYTSEFIKNSHNTIKSSSCGTEGRKLQTNGNNRTEVKAYYTWESTGTGDYRSYLWAKLRIKNQKRTLGVWFNAVRTTSYDLKVKYHFWSEGCCWEFFSYDKTATSSSFAKKEFETNVALTVNAGQHIEAYDMWCDTPSIDDIDIECNVAGL